jgi:hypothetical protein
VILHSIYKYYDEFFLGKAQAVKIISQAVFLFLFSCANTIAGEFKEGAYTGTGFEVRKNEKVVSSNSIVHRFESKLTIKKLSKNTYKFNLTAEVQQSANTKTIRKQRVDELKVLWRSETEGELINTNSKHKNDRCHFNYANDNLEIKCWIPRNQLWETQYYESEDKPVSSNDLDFGVSGILDTFCISTRLQLVRFKAAFGYSIEKKCSNI